MPIKHSMNEWKKVMNFEASYPEVKSVDWVLDGRRYLECFRFEGNLVGNLKKRKPKFNLWLLWLNKLLLQGTDCYVWNFPNPVTIKTSIENLMNEMQTVVLERYMFHSREKRSLILSTNSVPMFPLYETYTEFLLLIDALQFRNLVSDLVVRDAAVSFARIELHHRNNS